jgi:hypothetical protein
MKKSLWIGNGMRWFIYTVMFGLYYSKTINAQTVLWLVISVAIWLVVCTYFKNRSAILTIEIILTIVIIAIVATKVHVFSSLIVLGIFNMAVFLVNLEISSKKNKISQ